MRKLFLVLLSAFTFASQLSSCDSSTEPSDELSIKWVMPAKGSKYRFNIETLDSSFSSDSLLSSNRTTGTDDLRIVQSGVPFAGRDSAFQYGWSQTSRLYYITFEENGNTGYGDDPEDLKIYPTGKKGRTTIPTLDTTIMGQRLVTTGYFENFGKENLTVDSVTYSAIKLKERKETVVTIDSVLARTIITEHTNWFVPSLGFAIKGVAYSTTVIGTERTSQQRTQAMAKVL